MNAALITGVVCGVRVEAVDDPVSCRRSKLVDNLVDELAKGRPLAKIRRVTGGKEQHDVSSRHKPLWRMRERRNALPG